MVIDDNTVRRLGIAMADHGAAQQVANAINAAPSSSGDNIMGGDNTFTGDNTFVGDNTFALTTIRKLSVGPVPTDTYAATMTIDVTKGSHIISASYTTSATCTLTPSAAGTAGDLLTIQTTADSSGAVTVTFASTFLSKGTQVTQLSTSNSITFQSDGTHWIEVSRTGVALLNSNNTLSGNNTFTGSNTFSGAVVAQKLNLGPAPADTFSGTMTIDVTKSYHKIAASHTTSATSTLTPSGPGTAGDVLTIMTQADSSGTVTVTFASTFRVSGTQATTASTASMITFQSDGTQWIEQSRTTAISATVA